MKLGDFGGKEVKQLAAPAEEKKSRVSIILDTLAGVFTPLMPLIAGAGMIKALLSVLTLFGWIDKSGNLYYFLNFIADSSYYSCRSSWPTPRPKSSAATRRWPCCWGPSCCTRTSSP